MRITNDNIKQGALDALRLLITSKERPLQLKPDEIGDSKLVSKEDKKKLKMPKNVEVESDDTNDKDKEKDGEKQQGTKKPLRDPKTIKQPDDKDDGQGGKGQDGQDNTSQNDGSQGSSSQNRGGSDNETVNTVAEIGDITDANEQEASKLDNDPEAVKQDLDDYFNTVKSKQIEITRRKKQEDELRKRAEALKNRVLKFPSFKTDLLKAVADQVRSKVRVHKTYQRMNPTYANSKLIMRGKEDVKLKQIPHIQVYLDCSGSMTGYHQQIKDALKTLSDYEKKKLITLEYWYFADEISQNARDVIGGCTEAFDKILTNIKQTKPDNVLILTDRDFDGQSHWDKCEKVKIPGCMWWVWPTKNARSVRAMEYIIPRVDTHLFQYAING